jgi:hypothetical protein
MTDDNNEWMDRAACVDLDLEEFFQDSRAQRRKNPDGATRRAKRACANCAVINECFAATVRLETDRSLIQGYRAGLTAEERKELHKARSKVGISV